VAEQLMGIDIGTGSTKGIVTDAQGSVMAQAVRDHRISLPRPGWAEMDAERDWWGDVVSVCRDLLRQVRASAIAGVTVAGLGPCLVVCDAGGRPLRPAILYGIDMRGTEQIAQLTQRYGEAALLARCGKLLSSQAVGPKLLWLQRHEGDVYARARRWYSSHSYVVGRLTGEYVLDHVTASQCDPLYRLDARVWDADWAREVAPGPELPRLVSAGEVVGEVTAGAADATGLAPGTPVCAGTVDAWAEAFSAGVREPGDVALTYGSTLFVVQQLAEMSAHPGLWTTAGVDGSYTLAAGMATSGSLTRWVQDLTGDVPFETLVREAAEVRPGADGLVVLPHFVGERSPIFDPRARGVVAGLTLRHRRGHVFRAVYEGIAFGLRQILDAMVDAVGEPARLIAVGGGTQGGLWTQIVSDVTQRAQLVPTETIGASYGAALLAAIGTGLLPPGTDWARIEREIRPAREHRETYDELYEVYGALYPATKPHVHRLAQLQERA
jgi:xylulokinase